MATYVPLVPYDEELEQVKQFLHNSLKAKLNVIKYIFHLFFEPLLII